MGSKKALVAVKASASNTGSSSSRLSTSSSRLLAPTASSLAKAHRASAVLKPVIEVQASKRVVQPKVTTQPGPNTPDDAALSMITNSPKPSSSSGPFSPRPGGVFDRPLDLPSGIPTPVKKRTLLPAAAGPSSSNEGESTVIRQRSLAGRKPRISRSKVIARLASQRAAGTSGSTIAPRASNGGKTRSSFGAKAQRSSFTGGGSSGNVLMSAKKRARQSEYARRRSRLVVGNEGGGGGGSMDVSDG
ncbi:uncharacterized protein LACBIDRAFT_317038 [Laccaria bicolor S238N-H82]|uniref:Predicted protein n=1 Tax=Laccaria bicolor (strain S238N-H82 / ATCC MYA-4686) TaxID=486041 RepID=B0D491_LACBS|nr:uncharacterized protein LACBIDRAFT_317038 [Laccaria bicolor S238N-H82]EDR10291.1 predicted protein [Laccaria bicolor S238N-H82]|eukprot:XP_001878741.1 predicted protein [Laccaria bicolor S238N-H82]